MSSHTIIQAVTASILKLLKAEFGRTGFKDVECLNWHPNAEKLAREYPCCVFYLFGVAENHELKEREPYQVRSKDKDGSEYDFLREPPIRLDLRYLLASYAAEPDSEQQMLGRAILTLYDNPDLTKLEDLRALAKEPSDKITLRMLPFSQEEQVRFWTALREPLRPACFYQVTVHIESERQRRFRRVEERVLDIHQKE